MARPSYKPKLPPPVKPIEQVQCATCGRLRAVYAGEVPRAWSAVPEGFVCDRCRWGSAAVRAGTAGRPLRNEP